MVLIAVALIVGIIIGCLIGSALGKQDLKYQLHESKALCNMLQHKVKTLKTQISRELEFERQKKERGEK